MTTFRAAVVAGIVLLWTLGAIVSCAFEGNHVGKCVGTQVADMLAALLTLAGLVGAAAVGIVVARATNRTWTGWAAALMAASAVVAFVVWTDIGPKGDGFSEDTSTFRR